MQRPEPIYCVGKVAFSIWQGALRSPEAGPLGSAAIIRSRREHTIHTHVPTVSSSTCYFVEAQSFTLERATKLEYRIMLL